MKLHIEGRLPFVSATLRFDGRPMMLDQVLLDTGSAGSVFAADAVRDLGIEPAREDLVRRIRGVGGSEFVYSKRIESVSVGEMIVEDFVIQVGAMEYGFPLKGIIGMDFLLATRATIDLGSLEVKASASARSDR